MPNRIRIWIGIYMEIRIRIGINTMPIHNTEQWDTYGCAVPLLDVPYLQLVYILSEETPNICWNGKVPHGTVLGSVDTLDLTFFIYFFLQVYRYHGKSINLYSIHLCYRIVVESNIQFFRWYFIGYFIFCLALV
jgi:hypothetical protein